MNHAEALQHLTFARAGGTSVGWVSPAVAVSLAAERSRGPVDVQFAGQAGGYASVIGLTEVLAGTDPVHVQGFQHGRTYSPLEWLYTHEHVHRCNETVGRLFAAQLRGEENRALRRLLDKIVGELHDNVASHSCGKGFAAAQVYGNRIEYAIADAGCGFLHNARRVNPSIDSDLAAIGWAFVRGNTSAPSRYGAGIEAQRGLSAPELGSYAADGDEHAGWGLDELRAMIDQTGGILWVASGFVGCTYSRGNWTPNWLPIVWPGVFIEFQVPRRG